MKTNSSKLISSLALAIGVACLSIGLLQGPPTLTSEAVASVALDHTGGTSSAQQPEVTTRPIESLRVGDRVLAKNPEVSISERESWVEPDWTTWKKLSVEMPKEDGSTLHVEIIRPIEWLESQVGFVVAERPEPECHIGPELTQGKGRESESFSANDPQQHNTGDPKETPDPVASSGATCEPTLIEHTAPLVGQAVPDTTTAGGSRRAQSAPQSLDPLVLPDLQLVPQFAIVGLTVELDLAEMGAVGTGIITDVADCPEVQDGEGQVVTATFRHPPATDVLDVWFEDAFGKCRESSSANDPQQQNTGSPFPDPPKAQASPATVASPTAPELLADREKDSRPSTNAPAGDQPLTAASATAKWGEPIGVTDNHLFWSVDRQQFAPIGEMEIGERVQTYHGETKRIASKLPRPGPPKEVYNLEVYGENVYFVGQQAVLAHNSCEQELLAETFLDYIEFTRRGSGKRAVSRALVDGQITAKARSNLTGRHILNVLDEGGAALAYRHVEDLFREAEQTIHPILARRLRRFLGEQEVYRSLSKQGIKVTGLQKIHVRMGLPVHAEVQSFNDALWLLGKNATEADAQRIVLAVRNLDNGGLPFPRCMHCQGMTRLIRAVTDDY